MGHGHKHDPDKNHKDLPNEHSNGDVAQHVNSTIPAISRLRLLLAHDRHPPAEHVAEIIAEHPKHGEHVVKWLHEHFGNAFVHEVMTKGKKTAQHARRHDESFETSNKHADHGHNGPNDDPNRMTDAGTPMKLEHAVSVYRGDGSAYNQVHVLKDRATEAGAPPPQLATLPPASAVIEAAAGSELRVDTGAVKLLNVPGLDGHVRPQECVLCFQVGNIAVTGWVPTWAIYKVHHAALVRDAHIATGIHREGAKEQYAHHPRTLMPKPAPHGEAHLRIAPNQGHNGANMAEHYCQRPGGIVNLLSNVPGGTDARMGVATDVLVAGTHFFAATSVAPEHCPLYETGRGADQTDKKLTFIYGKVGSPNGAQYGWINHAMLS
ncbi:hypothetical protein BH11MYX1_BH11MYX1_21190 [soil metagenome]